MKKFYILTIIFALLGISQAWATTAKIEGSDWNNNRSWSNNDHVTFTLAGENTSYSDGITGTYLQIKGNTNYTVSWAVDPCYKIEVTQIKGKFGNGSTSKYEVYYNDIKCGTVKGWNTNDNVYLNGLSLGNNGSITISTTGDANIYWLEMTYTITPYTYTVIFHADDATDGTMANQAFNYGETKNLTTNGFERSYTVTYNPAGGNCEEASATADYEFAGWATSAGGAVVYTDAQSVSNLSTVDGGEVNLYAKWNSVAVTLPEATKEGSLFNGWYIGEVWVGKAGDTYVPSADIELTAHWVDKLIPQFVLDKTEIELEQKAVLTLTHVDNPTVQIAPEGILEYNAENGELTGIGVGEATITITQAATTTIAGKSEALKLNVTKKTPSLAVVLAGVEQSSITINPSLSAAVTFNKVSDGDVEVSPVSGNEFTVYDAGYITALYQEGTSVFRATLAETETYKGTSADFSVIVAYAEESDGSYVLVETDQHSVGVYDNNKGLEYDLSAPGKTLHVKVGKYSNAATNTLHIYGYKADGSESFHKEYDAGVLTTDGEDKHFDIEADVVKVKFIAGGTISKWFSNVRVTRRGFVEASAEEIQTAPTMAGEGTLAVKYSIANGGDLKIVCDNEKFTLDSYTIKNVDDKSGIVNIPVHFAAQAEEGKETANLIIYNGVYYAEYQISANVHKLIPVVTAPVANVLTFTDAEQELVAAGATDGGELQYRLGEGEWSTTVPAATNAGDYVVWYRVVGDEIYEDVAEASVNVTIAKAASVLTKDPEAKTGLVENGEEQVLIIAGETEDGELQYSLDGENYSAELPTGEEAGTYTVYYKVVGDVNHFDSTPATLEVIIAEATTTGISDIEAGSKAKKILRDGQIYILRDGKVYNINGFEVR